MQLSYSRLTLLILTVLFMSQVKAQSFYKADSTKAVNNYVLPKPAKFNTWDIGAHFGLTYPSTDITGNQKLAIGADLTKFLSQNFALQIRLMHASLSGTDVNQPDYIYNTTIAYDFSLNAIVQMGNFTFLPGAHHVAVYGSAGFGIMHYSPHVFIDGGHVPLKGIYSQYTAPLVVTDYENSNDFVIPLGIGAKYKVNDKYALRLEYSVRRTYSDKLDGFFKLLSADDSYSYLNVGVTYQLGSEERTLQWSNPLQTAYDDLYKVKEQLDQFSKDSDGDGVIDLYDKEKNTPSGAKVYGDGTSIDTDDDGVPDYMDSELFSSKYAIVDATGREIVVKQTPVEIPQPQQQTVVTAKTDSQPVKKELKQEKPLPEPVKNIPQKPVVAEEKNNVTALKETAVPAKDSSKPEMPKENIVAQPAPPVEKPVEIPAGISKDSLPSIYFSVKEDRISEKHFASLKIIGKIMNDNPGVDYRIVGVCDSYGSAQFNLKLGKRRAEAVKRYLIAVHKINPFRLTTEAKIQKTSTGSSAENRRVDFVKK